MENIKASQSNLFVHRITSDFRALLDRERIHVIEHDLVANMHEKIGKLWHGKSNIFSSIQGFFGPNFQP